MKPFFKGRVDLAQQSLSDKNVRNDMKPRWEKVKTFIKGRRFQLLGCAGLAVLVGLLIVYNYNFGGISDSSTDWGTFGDFLGGTSGSVFGFLSFVGILWTISLTYDQFHNEKARQSKEDEDKKSLFLFQEAKLGLEEVYDLLKDQNNDRMVWIKAARDLLRARKLATSIVVPEYQEVYRLTEDKIRYKLYLVLSVYDNKNKTRSPLPPQFFYGVKDWQMFRPLNDVAIEVSQRVKVYAITIDKTTPPSSVLPLDSKSVTVIYDFLEVPPDYDDPLKGVERWKGDWESYRGISEGARRFVYHVTNNMALEGKLYPKKKS